MHSMSVLSCLMVNLRTEDGLYLDEELVRFVPRADSMHIDGAGQNKCYM